MGVSIVEVRDAGDGRWEVVRPSPWARRITASTPMSGVRPRRGSPADADRGRPEGAQRARHDQQLSTSAIGKGGPRPARQQRNARREHAHRRDPPLPHRTRRLRGHRHHRDARRTHAVHQRPASGREPERAQRPEGAAPLLELAGQEPERPAALRHRRDPPSRTAASSVPETTSRRRRRPDPAVAWRAIAQAQNRGDLVHGQGGGGRTGSSSQPNHPLPRTNDAQDPEHAGARHRDERSRHRRTRHGVLARSRHGACETPARRQSMIDGPVARSGMGVTSGLASLMELGQLGLAAPAVSLGTWSIPRCARAWRASGSTRSCGTHASTRRSTPGSIAARLANARRR